MTAHLDPPRLLLLTILCAQLLGRALRATEPPFSDQDLAAAAGLLAVQSVHEIQGDPAPVLSRNGQVLVAAGANTAANTTLVVRELRVDQPGHRTKPVLGMALEVKTVSDDGKTLVGVTANESGDQSICFWDLATGKKLYHIDNDRPIAGLSLSPDGTVLAVLVDNGLELWDAKTGDEIRTLEGMHGPVGVAAFSPDGKALVVAGQTDSWAEVWEVATGGKRQKFQCCFRGRESSTRGIKTVCFSPEGRIVCVAGVDHAIYFWDLVEQHPLPPLDLEDATPLALGFNANGTIFIAVTDHGDARFWDFTQLEHLPVGPPVPLSTKEVTGLWRDLPELRPAQLAKYIERCNASPERFLTLARPRLLPVAGGDRPLIDEMVKALQDDNAAVRRKAMATLRLQGEAALGALLQLTEQERHQPRIDQFLHKLEKQYDTMDRRRALRAVELLEWIEHPAAAELLKKLAEGAPGARLTTEAHAVIERDNSRGQLDPEVDDFARQWVTLSDQNATESFLVMRSLRAARAETVRQLSARLVPVPIAEPITLAKLIADLDSERYPVRERATQLLTEFGDGATTALRQALKGNLSVEAARRVEEVLQKIDPPVRTGAQLRISRAIELLEGIGGKESLTRLRVLARGAPQAQLTLEANAACQRLSARTR